MSPRSHGVAYLVSQYPKLSHSFIASEIDGVRSAGVDVDTYSVREPSAAEPLGERDQREAQHTTYLIRAVRRHPLALLRFMLGNAGMVARGLWEALRFCPPGVRVRAPFYLLEALALLQHMSTREPRHIHVHLSNNAADVAHLATTMGPRLDGRTWTWSLAVHGPNELSDTGVWNLSKKARSASFVASITEYCRSQVMTLLPRERWTNVHVVRMGIDPLRFPPIDRDRRSGAIRLLFVGRLVAEKAPQLLVSAMARFAPGTFTARIIGDGELREDLVEVVRSLDLCDHVQLVGPVAQDELLEHYRWADVFCLPSFAEGLPVVLMEAMATGLPVVSTRIAGIPELVIDGRTGVLVAPGSEAALADALAMLRDEGIRRRLGEAGPAAVQRDHVARDNAQRLATLFVSTSTDLAG